MKRKLFKMARIQTVEDLLLTDEINGIINSLCDDKENISDIIMITRSKSNNLRIAHNLTSKSEFINTIREVRKTLLNAGGRPDNRGS